MGYKITNVILVPKSPDGRFINIKEKTIKAVLKL